MYWLKIENLPEHYKKTNRMFIVKAIDIFPSETSVFKYTTDPYCVWFGDGTFIRWPHKFPPTHYAILPDEVET